MFGTIDSSFCGISRPGFLHQNQFEQGDNSKDVPLYVRPADFFSISNIEKLDCYTFGVQNNALLHTPETMLPSDTSEGDLACSGLEGFNSHGGYSPQILNQKSAHDQTEVSNGNLPELSSEDRCRTSKALLDVLFVLQEKIQKLVDAVQLMDNEGEQNVQGDSVAGSVALIISQLFVAASSLLQDENLLSLLAHLVHLSSPQPTSLEDQIPPVALPSHAQLLLQPKQTLDTRMDNFSNDEMTNPSQFAMLGPFALENFFDKPNASTPDIGGANSSGVAVDVEPLNKQGKVFSSTEENRVYPMEAMESTGRHVAIQHGNAIRNIVPNQRPDNMIEPNNDGMISSIVNQAPISTEDHQINNMFQGSTLKQSPNNNGVENDIHGLCMLGDVCTEDHDMCNMLREEEEDGEGEILPPGSYELIEMAATEILAEHTHFCDICGKGFKRDANLRMHMRGHGDEYKTPAALARPDKANHDPSTIKLRRYSCPYIGCKRNKNHRKFNPLKTILCVKNHYKRSHCPKLLTCMKCKMKKFSVVADLKTHEKHCGRDKWQCSCGTTFSRKDKLVGHMGLFAGHTLMHEMNGHVDGNMESCGPLSSGYGHGLEDISSNLKILGHSTNCKAALNASSEMDKSKTIPGVNVLLK